MKRFDFGGNDVGADGVEPAAGDEALDIDAVVARFFHADGAGLVEAVDEVVAGMGNEERKGDGFVLEAGFEAVEQGVEAQAGMGADKERAGELGLEFGEAEGVGKAVDFVEDGEDAGVVGAEFVKDFEGGGVVAGGLGAGGVDDVDEEIGDDGFLEGGLEGFDEAFICLGKGYNWLQLLFLLA